MGILIAVHVVVCLALILIVLLQAGRGMGSLLGGGESVFGSLGPAGFLKKLTVGAAIMFMVTSLSLALISAKRKPSLIKREAAKEERIEEAKAGEAGSEEEKVKGGLVGEEGSEEQKVEEAGTEETPAPLDKK